MEEDFLLANPFTASRRATNRGNDLPGLFASSPMLGNLPPEIAMNAITSALQRMSPMGSPGAFDEFAESGTPSRQDLLYRKPRDPVTGEILPPDLAGQIERGPHRRHPDQDIRDSIQLLGGEGSMFPTHQLPGASPFIQPTPSVVDQTIAAQEMGPMGPQLSYRDMELASGAPRLTPMGNPMRQEMVNTIVGPQSASSMGTPRTDYPIHPDVTQDPSKSWLGRLLSPGGDRSALERTGRGGDDPRLLPAYGGNIEMNLPPSLSPNIIPMDTVGSQEMGPQDTFRQGGTAEKIEDGQVVRARKPGQFFDVTPDEHGGRT